MPIHGKREFEERYLGHVIATSQPAAEALRKRIREVRKERELSQKALAEAMTTAGVPLTFQKVSLIERGQQPVQYEELLAFAAVLNVPLVRLMSPLDGEPPIRAGVLTLERNQVGNWLVAGPWWSDATKRLQTRMGLSRQIATMRQVVVDEKDPEQKKLDARTLLQLEAQLTESFEIAPGVMRRQALRDEMENAPREGETL